MAETSSSVVINFRFVEALTEKVFLGNRASEDE